jgi:ribosomal protein S27AE
MTTQSYEEVTGNLCPQCGAGMLIITSREMFICVDCHVEYIKKPYVRPKPVGCVTPTLTEDKNERRNDTNATGI